MHIKEFLYAISMNGEKFERLFIEEAIRQGEAKYGSVIAYGVAVWPEKEKRTAGQTMYNLKNTTKTGKPQSVRLHEAVRMVHALDDKKEFASFCFEISERLRMREKDGEVLAAPLKNDPPENQELPPSGSTQPSGPGTGVET